MKYTQTADGTVTLDGSPDEIASYHQRVAKPKPVVRRSYKRRTKPKKAFHRGQYTTEERHAILSMARAGKSVNQSRAKLWKDKISPHKRTYPAIRIEINRMAADSNRR